MSGHNKWSQIKRKKALVDEKKGKVFGKLAKEIELAAQKGDDPQTNANLKTAIEKAKAANMPNSNIERAVEKALGKGTTNESLEELLYEVYGPGGVAIIIRAVTDNKNRTVAEVKHILSKNSGSLAEEGSVTWLFEEKGVIDVVATKEDKKRVEEIALEAGAEDVVEEENKIKVLTSSSKLKEVKDLFLRSGMEIGESGVKMVPKTKVKLSEKEENILEKLTKELEDQPDIQDVFTNKQ